MMLVLSLSQKHNHKEAVEIFHVVLEFQVHSHPYPVIPASCSASEEAGGRSMLASGGVKRQGHGLAL